MKETPTIFKAEMVNAILDGHKTMTRRIAMPHQTVCPYGYPGDRLWVKENYSYHGCSDSPGKGHERIHKAFVKYKADPTGKKYEIVFPTSEELWANVPRQNIKTPEGYDDLDPVEQHYVWSDLLNKWWKQKQKGIPSIFMFRGLSRVTLEIIFTKIERLQDISEEDAVKEGCINDVEILREEQPDGTILDVDYRGEYARDRFQDLWCRIHGKKSWQDNPMVWAIEFKKIFERKN